MEEIIKKIGNIEWWFFEIIKPVSIGIILIIAKEIIESIFLPKTKTIIEKINLNIKTFDLSKKKYRKLLRVGLTVTGLIYSMATGIICTYYDWHFFVISQFYFYVPVAGVVVVISYKLEDKNDINRGIKLISYSLILGIVTFAYVIFSYHSKSKILEALLIIFTIPTITIPIFLYNILESYKNYICVKKSFFKFIIYIIGMSIYDMLMFFNAGLILGIYVLAQAIFPIILIDTYFHIEPFPALFMAISGGIFGVIVINFYWFVFVLWIKNDFGISEI